MYAHAGARLGSISGIIAVVGLMALNSSESESTAVLGAESVALLLFVPFLVYLYSVLRDRRTSQDFLPVTALGAGLVFVTVKLIGVLPVITVRQGELSPALGDALQRLADGAFILSLLPLGLCLGAVAGAVLRLGVLPAWLGWMAAVVAALLVANSFDHGSDLGPAFVLFLLWVLLAAIVLLRRAVEEPNLTAPAGRVAAP